MEERTIPTPPNPQPAAPGVSDAGAVADKHKGKHGGARPGAGRKPGATNRKKKPDAPAEPDLVLQQNLALVKRTFASILGAVDRKVTSDVTTQAEQLGCDADLAKELAKSAGLSPDELGIICDSGATIVCRYELLTKFAPEVALFLTLASYGARVLTVKGRLRHIAVEQKKKQAAEAAPLIDKDGESPSQTK